MLGGGVLTDHTVATYMRDLISEVLNAGWTDSYQGFEERPVVWILLVVDQCLESGNPIKARKVT